VLICRPRWLVRITHPATTAVGRCVVEPTRLASIGGQGFLKMLEDLQNAEDFHLFVV
jgi:hypothetical protein